MEGLSYRIMAGGLLIEAQSNQGPHHNARSGLIKFQTSKTKYFHRINHVMDLKREHTLYNIYSVVFCLKCVKS